ncbi:MAG: inorganic phosphate transporter [Oscillospiraceae bacterium]|nr:inorganic phosphate transporter [Oscillospiraceae bacterium]
MTLRLTDFFAAFASSPMLLATALLLLGVVFVNGWTDAPNAIATCVSTRSLGVRPAILMAALCNFLGIVVMTSLNATVAQTMFYMVDFGGDNRSALAALCAAMAAIVLWAVAAWYFGIPTSESHALIAGLSGAAIAIQHGFGGINPQQWSKVLYGLLLSAGLGFGLGLVSGRLTQLGAAHMVRSRENDWFRRGQVLTAAGSAFMHGAQDGQKFLSVFLLGMCLAQGGTASAQFSAPLWLILLCSVVMALGTSLGGYRIIKSVGMDMVKLEAHEGFAADLAASACLLFSSLGGLPVSTTHTKTTAIMGVGAAKSLRNVNWSVVREMVLAWLLTFPGCGLIGWGMALLFLRIF